MLSLRLSRVGHKGQPSYRLIVVDKRRDPWGEYLENLGWYNPGLSSMPKIQLKSERIAFWLQKGAQPSATVWNLLVQERLLSGPKQKKHTSAKKKSAAAGT